MIDVVELVLECVSWQQAQHVSDYLLSRRLVSRIEALSADDIKLLLTTTEHLVDTIRVETETLLQVEQLQLRRIPLARFNHYTISGTELRLNHTAASK